MQKVSEKTDNDINDYLKKIANLHESLNDSQVEAIALKSNLDELKVDKSKDEQYILHLKNELRIVLKKTSNNKQRFDERVSRS